MTSLITTTLHTHFKVSCWQGGPADSVEIRWKAVTIATSAFHSCGNPFSKWSVRDYHQCFSWLKGEGLQILKEILSLPAPIFNSALLTSLSRVCWGYTGKERLGLRSSSILWRADSCGAIGNEKRKILSRFQADLLGAWLDQNQQVCSRLCAALSGSWKRCLCHREQAGDFQKKTSYLFCSVGFF